MNHQNRTWIFLSLLVTLSTHMYSKGAGPVAWVLLVFQFLAYPQLAYRLARTASNPRRAERNNMLADGMLFGLWAAALEFPVWITFILFIGVAFNLTVFYGRMGFFQSLAAMALGAGVYVGFAGFKISPQTGLPTTLLSIACVSMFMLIIAQGVYERSVKLHEARERLRVSEQALQQKLDEITALQSRLSEQANRDPLTGLYNRRYFNPTLDRELIRCERDQQPLSLIMIDIDHFKRVNDEFGHQADDQVLKTLATLLNGWARGSDVACRYGGEEFLMLLPNMALVTALERAEAWRDTFSTTAIAVGTAEIRVTLSLGVATYPQNGRVSEDLIRCADVALYCAKSEGRNRVVVSRADADAVVNQSPMLPEIAGASVQQG